MFHIENWALAYAAVLACYIEVAPFISSGFKDHSQIQVTYRVCICLLYIGSLHA